MQEHAKAREGSSRMRLRSVCLMMAMLGVAAACTAAGDGWNTYGNARYGFSVCYPATVLFPEGESDNGDGNTFATRDKSVIVRAYAGYAMEPEGGRKALAERFHMDVTEAEKHGYKISYQSLKPGLYAYSGVAHEGTPKARVIYQKTFERAADKADISLEAEYPESASGMMNPVIDRMAGCLTKGKPSF